MSPTNAANYVPDRMRASSGETLRVFVAESCRMGSELIETALKRNRQRFEVHALSIGSSEVFRELEKSKPDVTILSSDLEDGHLTGFRVLYQLRGSQSRTPVVMLLDSAERDLVIDAFRGGAKGVFSREDSISSLPRCIRAVHCGQFWVNNAQLQFLFDLIVRMSPLPVIKPGGMALLTSREQEITRLVAEGMRNQEIALKLGISEHTTRNYLCHIFEKLGLSTRVELVLYALSR
jgi:DNA-binding NarL/FixJ family response regulator